MCFTRNHQKPSKLEPRGLKCIFLGYSPTQKGYKCYHPPTRRFFVSINVVFNEKESYFKSNLNGTPWVEDSVLNVPLLSSTMPLAPILSKARKDGMESLDSDKS